jgi:predicted metalloprotease
MKVYTSYDEITKTGNTIEEIYLLLNPETIKTEGIVNRLEKCGNREERVLLTRPYCITLRAERIIVASISTEKRKIIVGEAGKKVVMFTGPSAFYAAHEMEHLEHIEIDGLPMWAFKYGTADTEPGPE